MDATGGRCYGNTIPLQIVGTEVLPKQLHLLFGKGLQVTDQLG